MKRAFTLVELLVVIFIIAVLIAILIPTISSVQRSAMTADTKNLISQLSSAITRYHQDFNAYPGPFSNDQIAAGGAPQIRRPNGAMATLTGASGITHSENLTLALLGGLRFDGTTFTFDASDTQQARGAVSLNPSAPKRYAAYMKVRDGMLSNGRMADTYPGMSDSAVPEFVDTWPADDKLPILYARARRGATGVISDATGSGQYDIDQIRPYLRSGDGLQTLEPFDDPDDLRSSRPDYGTKADPLGAFHYFRHPSLGGAFSAAGNANGTPQQKDGFVLIAAGPDRVYGTNDDITSFGD